MESSAVSFLEQLPVYHHDQARSPVIPPGGERSRLSHGVADAGPNFLLLDEPTNNLDIASAEVFGEHAGRLQRGTALIISHDRYFLDRVVDRIVELDDGALVGYPAMVSWYQRAKSPGSFAERISSDVHGRRTSRHLKVLIPRKREWAYHSELEQRMRSSWLVNAAAEKPGFSEKARLLIYSDPWAAQFGARNSGTRRPHADRAILPGYGPPPEVSAVRRRSCTNRPPCNSTIRRFKSRSGKLSSITALTLRIFHPQCFTGICRPPN